MSDTELFQEAVAPIGGLYRSGEGVSPEVADHVETHFAWLAQYARVLESEARCAFRPCFGLIANREFNAVAFRIESGTACVGINVGAIQAIDGIFCRMMASRSIMVQIGSIEKEVEQLPLQSPHLETLTDSMTAQTLPRCPTRRWFADAHTKQAIRFLLRHELAHIANGHVDFLAAQHGQRFTTELDWINGDASAQFDRQVIEFDADCCAASWWCGVFLEEWFKQSGCLKPSEMADAEVDLAVKDELGMAFFQWAFSVSTLFRLFGDARFAGNDLVDSQYPPLRLRQVAVLRTVIDQVRLRWNSRLSTQIAPFVWGGLDVAEAGVELVTGSDRQVHGLSDAVGPEGWAHIDRIIEHWKSSLRPRLLPYSRGGYLPY